MIKREIGNATLYCGDCREILPTLAGGIDVVVADPPYSSGGAMRSDRNLPPSLKYRFNNALKVNHDFSGDNRDQRSFTLWCSNWMAQCLEKTRPGGALFSFIDWRNLPCLIDAVQVGGWVYRGIIPWNKTEATRPQKGWFRAQCEYIITASADSLVTGLNVDGICAPGFFSYYLPGLKKQHLTEKPIELFTDLISTRDDWQVILDPFMGSCPTGIAALSLGRKFIGIEKDPAYFDIACKRIERFIEDRSLLDIAVNNQPAPQQARLEVRDGRATP